ncbi:hypothetical protein [Sphingobium indicum]|nr:hypothetical protein [Sphingobium indicum]
MSEQVQIARMKVQILELQGQLLQFHHRDAVAELQAAMEAAAKKDAPAAAADDDGDHKSGIPIQ